VWNISFYWYKTVYKTWITWAKSIKASLQFFNICRYVRSKEIMLCLFYCCKTTQSSHFLYNLRFVMVNKKVKRCATLLIFAHLSKLIMCTYDISSNTFCQSYDSRSNIFGLHNYATSWQLKSFTYYMANTLQILNISTSEPQGA
jgi:hypothetical protein